MKKRLDFKILENADKDILDALSSKYSAVSNKEAEKIFERVTGNTEAHDAEIRIHGVEVYRRPVWRKMLAAASAFVLVAGAVTGSVLLLKNFRRKWMCK